MPLNQPLHKKDRLVKEVTKRQNHRTLEVDQMQTIEIASIKRIKIRRQGKGEILHSGTRISRQKKVNSSTWSTKLRCVGTGNSSILVLWEMHAPSLMETMRKGTLKTHYRKLFQEKNILAQCIATTKLKFARILKWTDLVNMEIYAALLMAITNWGSWLTRCRQSLRRFSSTALLRCDSLILIQSRMVSHKSNSSSNSSANRIMTLPIRTRKWPSNSNSWH